MDPSPRPAPGHQPADADGATRDERRGRRRKPGAIAIVAAVAIIAAAALLLIETEDRELRERTLIIALTDEPRSLDPHTTTSANDFRICTSLYEGLVRFAPGSLEIEPALASSWDISDDGLRYTFELREGVRFHDGSALDADAVAFNFNRMLDPDHPEHDTGPFPFSFFFDSIESVEVADSHTVVLHLSEPFAPLLANLAYPTGLIVSPAAVREHGSDFGRHPSGTGPFRFIDWQSRRKVVLERHHPGSPDNNNATAATTATEDAADAATSEPAAAGVERLLFRPITDPAARTAELLAGSVDVVLDVPPDVLARLRRDPGLTVEEVSGTHLWFLILNCRHGPFSDRRMREAVNLAVDREAITGQLLQGTATAADSAFPEAFDWIPRADAADKKGPDPERARELVLAAGHKDASLRLWVPEGGSGMLQARAMAEAIQADLARIGLSVRIEVFEWNSFLERVNAGLDDTVDMAAMAWMVNDPDTLPYLTLRSGALPEHGGFNSGYFEDPRLDELLEQGRRAVDPASRADIYRRADAIIRRQHPWLIVASEKQHAVTRTGITGIELHPSFLLRLAQAKKAPAPP